MKTMRKIGMNYKAIMGMVNCIDNYATLEENTHNVAFYTAIKVTTEEVNNTDAFLLFCGLVNMLKVQADEYEILENNTSYMFHFPQNSMYTFRIDFIIED